uniref:B30.2/SPRY domain-containing protein n=1 Tax=Globodera pallida TaxID=36090 RepID=A0A183C587_GLOPA
MSISTTKSINGDITADQEHLWPTFANLDPSEELRLLRDRIAQLERQQMINSPISSSSFDLMAQNGNDAAGTLKEIRDKIGEIENLVERLQQGQLRREKEQLNALQEKVVKMEKYQKQQQLNIVDLQKTVAAMLNDTINANSLTLQNRWDYTVCHEDLTLIEPDRLIAQFTGQKWGHCSVFAAQPIPKGKFGIFYYETTILRKEGLVFIGLATKRMRLDVWVGLEEGTYAYASYGLVFGHEVEGCGHFAGRCPYIEGMAEFEVRDVVGCGVNLATRQIIYTLNGQRLETTGLFVDDSAADLFPCVTLLMPGAKIEANFGPNFNFKIDEGF